MGKMVIKYAAAGLVLASLFTLVILGQMTSGEYQVIAIATLSALGGYHAGSAKNAPPDHIEHVLGMVKTVDPTQPVNKE